VTLVEATTDRLTGGVVLPGGTRFRRSLRLEAASLVIEDRVDGPGVCELVSSVPLAPDATVRATPLHGAAEFEQRTFAERFGGAVAAPAAVQRVRTALPWEGGWRLDWDGR
jgi:hypothetical protein